ncbi:hypothetical protein Hamer_G011333 [Homarus americanus]|uniref:Uncharacterized protein n=1 Tax=Homarus americanus TaxID=6706 RepID=A0A8J5JPZ1_HOMAM|nr:hypothetical protein Hamer_G011333 [Homarus americanus]
MTLYSEQCWSSNATDTSWSQESISSCSSTDISVVFVDKKVVFHLLGTNTTASITTAKDAPPADLFVYLESQSFTTVIYDCYLGCRSYSSHASSEPSEVESLEKSSPFFIYTHPSFLGLQFRATLTKPREALDNIAIDSLKQTAFTAGVWNRVQVLINTDKYRVLVDGHERKVISISRHHYSLAKVHVLVKGVAFWSIDCQPQPVSTWQAKDSPEREKAPTVLTVTVDTASPMNNDVGQTMKTLKHVNDFRFIFYVVLGFTVAVDAVAIVNLALTLHLLST